MSYRKKKLKKSASHKTKSTTIKTKNNSVIPKTKNQKMSFKKTVGKVKLM